MLDLTTKLRAMASAVYMYAEQPIAEKVSKAMIEAAEALEASPWRDTAEELPRPYIDLASSSGWNVLWTGEKWINIHTGIETVPPKQWAYITDLLPESTRDHKDS